MTLASITTQTSRNLKQTWGSQLMTLLTVSLSVLIFSFFFLVYLNLQKAGVQLGAHIRLIVYMEDEVAPPMRPQIERKIRNFSGVEKIVFKSREDAYNHLNQQLGPDQDVLTDLDSSFLPPSIEVYPAKSLKTMARLKDFSDYLSTLPGAKKVQYGQNWIERLGHFTQLTRLIVLMSGALLVLTATFMVSSTIRLTVVTRHAELEILKLMGASKGYIQFPLILEGLLQGLLGSGLGLACLYFIYIWIKTKFEGPGFLDIFSFTFMPIPIVIAILAVSIGLCSIGSIISIRKFLRV